MSTMTSHQQDQSGSLLRATRSTRTSDDIEQSEPVNMTATPDTRPSSLVDTITSNAMSIRRRAFLKNFLTMLGICTLVMWACLTLFWGTSAHTKHLLSTLDVQVINFDSAPNGLGDFLTTALQRGNGSITYTAVDATLHYPSGSRQVDIAVRRSGPWAAVVVEPNATKALLDGGNPSIGIYYSTARSHQVVLGTLLPLLESDLHSALITASGHFMQAQLCGNSSASKASVALLRGVRWYRHDVNPIHDWAQATAFSTCLVWLTVLTFLYAFSTYFARMSTGLLKTSSLTALIKKRLVGITVMYVCLSLWYTCMYLVFHVDTARHLGKGGSFFVLWTLNCLTTFSVGLALEVFLSLLTPRFFPFLLVTLIICNLSSVIVPVPLMHKFYRFAYAMPFYQNVQATKVILFETERRNALARYFGVLGAWVVLMLGLLVGAQWMEQKRVRPRGVQSSAHDERHEQESSDDAEDKVSDAEDKADSADEKQDYDEEATTPVE